ncbi:MAG: phosphoadenosine phosphosulfate reductase family protein [Desulfonauticus sp.]|nr:phosphoadenosine phosphosulfate reductase family protein [Desulfonauticus sp.]
MALDEKLYTTINYFDYIFENYNLDNIYVAWTGGKDSTLVLFLWKRFLQERNSSKVKAVNIDTGLKFPEVIQFRDKIAKAWNVGLTIVQPDVNLLRYNVAKYKLDCCLNLKIKPLKKAIRENSIEVLLTGIRADENPARDKKSVFEKRTNPDYLQVNPILEWTEMDVWSFHFKERIPYCSLYDKGYRSLGCMPCTSISLDPQERSGRNQEKEAKMDVLTSLGYF